MHSWNISYALFRLSLERPFSVSHGTSAERSTLFVKVEHHGLEGVGEGAFVPYYPWQPEECLEWLSVHAKGVLERLQGEAWADWFDNVPEGPGPARTALEIALLDLWCQEHGISIGACLGIASRQPPPTARTISIPATEEELRARLADERLLRFKIIKLKLGSGILDWDEAIVRLTYGILKRPVALDANCGWSPGQTGLLLRRLEGVPLHYIEQPVARGSIEPWRELRALLGNCPVPLIADETVQRLEDLTQLSGLADGINVKLLKAGGLASAWTWIQKAKQLGMKIMVGSMIESSAGCTAAAQLAPACDFLDLDAPLEVLNDPWRGVSVEEGDLVLPPTNGLGLVQTGEIEWQRVG
jgi:L-alanine-DL-glutamate epimerase-like enolase superfamily enzyme